MTIGELARRTGMTIRNIRAHQTRGLLPPPEVQGRTGYYGEEHVARIELTREMQAEGLNLEAIRRVLESTGGSSKEIVDFARAVRAPFEDETPEIFGAADFAELWGSESVDERLLKQSRKARRAARPARRPGRGDQPAPAPGRDPPDRLRGQPGGGDLARGQAPRPRRRGRPRLRRPLHRADLGALRQGGPARRGLARGARGAGSDAAARLRRPAGDVPDHDGRGDRKGRRAHPAERRQTARRSRSRKRR